MKGTESISQLFWVAFFMLFLLLGLVIVISIVASWANPTRLMALGNVEALRSGINQVCFTGQPVEMEFTLPQNQPNILSKLFGVSKWIMNIDGDPHYVLYYEMFPPGNAIGWEVHHDFGYRTIVPVLPKEGEDDIKLEGNRMEDFLNDVRREFGLKVDSSLSTNILINNVILSEDFNPVNGKVYKEDEKEDGWGKYDEYDKNFLFNSYLRLTDENKTNVKYVACGENTLCLKTRDGVYRFPLSDHCGDIDYIGIDDTGMKDYNSLRDLNLVSPCQATGEHKIKIEKLAQGCECVDGTFVEYPIYEYDKDENKFIKVGSHTTCLVKKDSSTSASAKNTKPCIKITVIPDIGNYCFTPRVGTNPIGSSVDYVSSIKASILNPTAGFQGLTEEILGKLTWVWP